MNELKLGGIPITLVEGDLLNWSFNFGTKSNTVKLQILETTANQIWNLGPHPLTLEYNYKIKGSIPKQEFKGSIKNIFVTEYLQYIKLYDSTLILQDIRFILDRIRLYCRYNTTRKSIEMSRFFNAELSNISGANDEELDDEILVDPTTGTRTNKILEDYFSFNLFKYREWSINNQTAPFMINEILNFLMRSIFGGFYAGMETNKEVEKVSYDNLEFIGTPASEVIDGLCRQARLNLVLMNTGCVKLKPVDDEKIPLKSDYKSYLMIESQFPTKQKLERIRPVSVNVAFMKDVELLLCYNSDKENYYLDEWNSGRYNTTQRIVTEEAGRKEHKKTNLPDIMPKDVIYLINVAPVPYDMTINGINYPFGTYLPIKILMKEWNIDEASLRLGWVSETWKLRYLTEVYVKLSDYALLLIENYDRKYQAIVRTIDSHWRQTFAIPQKYMSYIGQLSATRVTMTNYVSNAQPPSPVWTNYIDCPPYTTQYIKFRQPKNIYAAEGEFWTQPSTPFTLEILDAELGLMRIQPLQDKQNIHFRFIPGTVREDTLPTVYMKDEPVLWSKAVLNIIYKIYTIVSARMLIPNNPMQMYNIKVKNPGAKSSVFIETPTKYEVYDVFFDKEPARFTFDFVNSNVSKKIEEPKFEEDAYWFKVKPKNIDILENIAKAEAATVEHRFRNRTVGMIVLIGEHYVEPSRNVQIVLNFDATEVKTIIYASDIPYFFDDIYLKLPLNVRQKIYRQIGG
jgi:hypothetical protein